MHAKAFTYVLAIAALLVLALNPAACAPSHYFSKHSTPAVHKAFKSIYLGNIQDTGFGPFSQPVPSLAQDRPDRRRLVQAPITNGTATDSTPLPLDCGTPPQNSETDRMWFTQGGCSRASTNFSYFDENGIPQSAGKGDLIKMTCDSVFCPSPPRPDCYELQNACSENEFCWINQHEKWGPWAMGKNGTTPLPEWCTPERQTQLQNTSNGLNDTQRVQMQVSYNLTCNTGVIWEDGLEIWKPVHGQCTTYRKIQQSCTTDPLKFTDPALNPVYARQPNGRVYDRPLLCDPHGGRNFSKLTCTGPDFDVLPSTCVEARPRDQCFSNPWWYSKNCPRTAAVAPPSGLTRDQALYAAATSLLLFPGEVGWVASCVFWDNTTAVGRATETARRKMYAIITKLWPVESIGGAVPSYEELMAQIPVANITGNITNCYANENTDGSVIASDLAVLNRMSMQPNQIWSLAHFVTFNQPAPMSNARVEGSKALAAHLAEQFWCDDCRGFFYEVSLILLTLKTVLPSRTSWFAFYNVFLSCPYNTKPYRLSRIKFSNLHIFSSFQGILVRYGMPPDSNDPEEHAKWWWWGHNVASEHTAATRGGHPWIYQFGDIDALQYQNPFFMSWEDAVAQWRVEVPSK